MPSGLCDLAEVELLQGIKRNEVSQLITQHVANEAIDECHTLFDQEEGIFRVRVGVLMLDIVTFLVGDLEIRALGDLTP